MLFGILPTEGLHLFGWIHLLKLPEAKWTWPVGCNMTWNYDWCQNSQLGYILSSFTIFFTEWCMHLNCCCFILPGWFLLWAIAKILDMKIPIRFAETHKPAYCKCKPMLYGKFYFQQYSSQHLSASFDTGTLWQSTSLLYQMRNESHHQIGYGTCLYYNVKVNWIRQYKIINTYLLFLRQGNITTFMDMHFYTLSYIKIFLLLYRNSDVLICDIKHNV